MTYNIILKIAEKLTKIRLSILSLPYCIFQKIHNLRRFRINSTINWNYRSVKLYLFSYFSSITYACPELAESPIAQAEINFTFHPCSK